MVAISYSFPPVPDERDADAELDNAWDLFPELTEKSVQSTHD